MRILAAAAPLLLLLLVPLAAAAATSNTSDSRERERRKGETWRIFAKWEAEHDTTDHSLTKEEELERAYAGFKCPLGLIDQRWCDDGYSVFPWEMGRSEEETRQIFAEWKVRNGKAYSSIAEEERRYALFKDSLRDVDWHNAGYAIGVHRYNHGIDPFGDLTGEEWQNRLLRVRRPSPAARPTASVHQEDLATLAEYPCFATEQ